MTMYYREPTKKNNEKMKNDLIPFSKQNSFNWSGVNFPKFAFSELTGVAKYGCVRLQ